MAERDRQRLALPHRGIDQGELRELGYRRRRLAVGGRDARIAEVQHRIGHQPVPCGAHLVDDRGHVAQCPHVGAAGPDRHQQHVTEPDGRAQRLAVTAAHVEHHVLIAPGLRAHLWPHDPVIGEPDAGWRR